MLFDQSKLLDRIRTRSPLMADEVKCAIVNYQRTQHSCPSCFIETYTKLIESIPYETLLTEKQQLSGVYWMKSNQKNYKKIVEKFEKIGFKTEKLELSENVSPSVLRGKSPDKTHTGTKSVLAGFVEKHGFSRFVLFITGVDKGHNAELVEPIVRDPAKVVDFYLKFHLDLSNWTLVFLVDDRSALSRIHKHVEDFPFEHPTLVETFVTSFDPFVARICGRIDMDDKTKETVVKNVVRDKLSHLIHNNQRHPKLLDVLHLYEQRITELMPVKARNRAPKPLLFLHAENDEDILKIALRAHCRHSKEPVPVFDFDPDHVQEDSDKSVDAISQFLGSPIQFNAAGHAGSSGWLLQQATNQKTADTPLLVFACISALDSSDFAFREKLNNFFTTFLNTRVYQDPFLGFDIDFSHFQVIATCCKGHESAVARFSRLFDVVDFTDKTIF